MNFLELKKLYDLPFFYLIEKAREIHKQNWPEEEIQLCTLLSIKTGGCSEDCSYCAQSSRYNTGLDKEQLLDKHYIVQQAMLAKENGSTRFCMGAAWRGVRDGTKRFDKLVDIVSEVSKLGIEVCTTLGEIGLTEANKLKEAGVTAYNHNIDTSEDFYKNIVSTHTFQDRLNTLKNIQDSGMKVCSGGILGLGESTDDRLKMIETLSKLSPQPESIPINSLVPIPGTPLGDLSKKVDTFDFVRIIAITRIAIPKAKVRLSAGRKQLSEELQSLCFFAGANSIFYGDKLLTTSNPESKEDINLISKLGLKTQKPYSEISNDHSKLNNVTVSNYS